MLSSTLSRYQDAFARAVLAPGASPDAEVSHLTAQPAFAVYRNTVMKGCIDALQANFPAVARLVGEEWFRDAAAVYVRQTLPTDPTLLRYGSDFADFLANFEPAAELPYLSDVARLDRLWMEAHTAPDEETLDPAAIAKLAPETLARTTLHPHASARWAWFADAPIYTIWSQNRGEAVPSANIDWKPEGALLVRRDDAVDWIALDAAGGAFLDTCAASGSLAAAADAALEAQSNVNLAQLLSTLLTAGVFSRMSVIND